MCSETNLEVAEVVLRKQGISKIEALFWCKACPYAADDLTVALQC